MRYEALSLDFIFHEFLVNSTIKFRSACLFLSSYIFQRLSFVLSFLSYLMYQVSVGVGNLRIEKDKTIVELYR